MQLCPNRPEGFGPYSALSSPLPTSCFVDTILLPLPVWIALAILPGLYIGTQRYKKTNFDPSTLHLRSDAASSARRSIGFTTTAAIYYILILCNILMLTLEIVRLELLGVGIGLLPFVYVGLLLGGLQYFTRGFGGKVCGWMGVNAVVWIGGIVMSIVQAVGLVREEGIDGRKGSKYPVSDQIIDVAVMAGVYAVIAVLEVILVRWSRRRELAVKDEVDEESRSDVTELSPGKGERI